MEEEENLEQTLHVAKEVSVFRVPPRRGADGYRSGEWRVGDKIFDGLCVCACVCVCVCVCVCAWWMHGQYGFVTPPVVVS